MVTTAGDAGLPQVVRPESLREARDALAEAAAADASVELRGAGASTPWVTPDPRAAVVLDTTGLVEPFEHRPGDMTVLVGAGTRLDAIEAELSARGQFIPVVPPSARDGATLGGALSAGDVGPFRHAYGGWRDAVIGMTVVLADATVARSGGRVIKNVAGYDLAKLFCGAEGTLGLVASVALRVHPRPEAVRTLRAEASVARAGKAVARLATSPLLPVALELAEGALHVSFAGTEVGVRDQLRRAASLCREEGLEAEELADEEAAAVARRVARATCGVMSPGAETTVVRAVTLPDRLVAAGEAATRLAGEEGLEASFASHAGIGVHTVRVEGQPITAHAGFVTAFRAAVEGLGGRVSVRQHPPGLADAELRAGPPPPAAAIMRRVKDALDPRHRLAPGRFAPWW